MKNTIIGIICFLIVAGTSLRVVDCSEEAVQPVDAETQAVEPEKEYKLI